MLRTHRLFLLLLLGTLITASFGVSAEILATSVLVERSQVVGSTPGDITPTPQGSADLSYDTTTRELSWTIDWQDLTGPPTVAHFHGDADPGSNAGVKLGIALSSPMATDTTTGSAIVNQADEMGLLDGLWYINIHTGLNGGGEIRGQVIDFAQVLTTSVPIERSQVVGSSPGDINPTPEGLADLSYHTGTRELSWTIQWQDLTGPPTVAHFHGDAAAGINAGVKVGIPLTNPAATDMTTGSAIVDQADEMGLLDELWYINIHTGLNSGGEIRGQVVGLIPDEIFADSFETPPP